MSKEQAITEILSEAREAYGAFGRAQRALMLVDQVLAREENNVEALNLKAAVLFEMDHDDEAREIHQRVLTLAPYSVEALHGLASIANGEGKYDEALGMLAIAFDAVDHDTDTEFVENEDFRQRLIGQLYVEKAFALWYSGRKHEAIRLLTETGPAACSMEIETFEDELAWLEEHPDEPE
jgi:tetratricopeptide (TPR) repeat protein